MNSKKKNYSGLCYLALFFLILLLILPVIFRIFGKNWYKKEEKTKNVVEILNCVKEKESIYSSFMNNVPQLLEYKVNGDYTTKVSDDGSTSNSSSKNINNLIDLIKDYSSGIYADTDDITTFKVNMSDFQQSKQYVGVFNNSENQTKYFNSLGFYCSKTIY